MIPRGWKLQNFVPLLAATVIFLFVCTLLFLLYHYASDLREAHIDRIKAERLSRANFLNFYLKDIREDLINISQSNELGVFFESKSLGMSMKFGLGYSLHFVKQYLENLIYRKHTEGLDIYLRIALIDRNGNVIADVGPYKRPYQWKSLLMPQFQRATLVTLKDNRDIIASQAVYYKNVYVGQLLAWLNPATLRHIVAQTGSTEEKNYLISYNGSSMHIIWQSDKSPPPCEIDPVKIKSTSSFFTCNYDGKAWLSLVLPVGYSNLYICSSMPMEIPSDKVHPRDLLLIIGGIAFSIFLGMILLISHRLQMEKALMESEKKHRLVVENAQEGILVIQNESIVFANRRSIQLLGIHEDNLEKISLRDFLNTEDYELFQYQQKECLMQGVSSPLVVKIFVGNGSSKRVQITMTNILWENKPAVLCFFTDVTERCLREEMFKIHFQLYESAMIHSTQEIIKQALEETSLLVESPIGFFARVEDGRIQTQIFLRENAEDKHMSLIEERVLPLILKYPLSECILAKKPCIYNNLEHYTPNITPSDKLPELTRFIAVPVMREGKIMAAIAFGNKPGNYTTLDEDLVTYLADMVWNILEHKRNEEARNESERQLFEILNFLPDATFAINEKGRVIFWNRAIEEMTGVPAEKMLGKDNYEYALPFYGYRRPILIDIALSKLEDMETKYTTFETTGDVVFGEAYTPTLPGGARFLSAKATVLRNRKGEIVGAIECIRDITDRKRLEEKLRRAEKMELIGILAGGVAHDLNNTIGVVVGYAELLAQKIDGTHPLRRFVDGILNSSMRSAAIIQDLLTLARRGVITQEVVNLNNIVLDYLNSTICEKLKTYHPHVSIYTDLESDLLNIKGSPAHLTNVVMNLVSNAAEAIKGEGKIVIKTENCYLDTTIEGFEELKEGNYVRLSVSDDGPGISPEDIEHIFEPFYTKKVMGRSGTGLGLTVVWGVVKDHQGFIDVISEEGKGTTFHLYFPVTMEEIEIEKEPNIEDIKGHGETILVVDDIREQRTLAQHLLTHLGYNVSVVSSGEEAEKFVKENDVDLVLLDMIMSPGIDGLETFKRIKRLKPDQKVILVSGFSETDRVKEALKIGAVSFLKKPYTMKKLALEIKNAFGK
ncbi:MAG: response regulator [Syntrophales bacterium]|nr:response regulator [Syntrophales bacterium]